jgi:16S rRNA (cytidine1402-2'-O)-methyltransferase
MSKFFIVPTPIGNLEDITFRAIKVLKEVDLVLAEDTRKTQILLKHYEITVKLLSHHKFNEHKSLNHIIKLLKEGNNIALVSDAGTPGISDPGFLIVREVIASGFDVECLPGPTALIPALVVSGLPCDRFCFEGFLPQKKGRNKKFAELANEERTMVFYESPFRLIKTLEQIKEYFGEGRKIVVARELSKIHEEIARGTSYELIEHFTNSILKGEIVIIVEGKNN